MRPINYRLVLKILGLMCLFNCIFVLITLFVAIGYAGDDVLPFLYTLGIMLTVGGGCFLIGRDVKQRHTDRREGILIVTLTWILFSGLGMLPFVFGGYTSSIVDAFFETISGYTTTGASIYPTVEQLPHGILFWRSIIQWEGGIGIVVFTMALLPLVIGDGGAAMLYNAETTGITHDKFLPRISEAAKRTAIVYFVITSVLVILLWAGPMNFFEAVCHAFTCISTGGYSTRNGSIADFNSPYTEYVLSAFMFVGSLSISLMYFCFVGKPKRLLKDEEFHWFLGFTTFFIVVTTTWLVLHGDYPSFESNFRHAIFQVYSLVSSTGYLTADIVSWRPFFWCVALILMFVCGCAGSTAGGLKMSRFLVSIKNLRNEFLKRIHPNIVVPVRANGAVIPGKFVSQVLAFVSIYVTLIVVGFLLLCLDGIDFTSAFGAAVSCTGNVGPALGNLMSNYSSVSEFSKWVLCFLMLAGRLEIFTVLVIFHPAFWRK